MPISHQGIRELEDLADRAWPPAEVLAYDEWLLRATGPGIGRRVNSVAVGAEGGLPLGEKVAFVEAFYRSRGLLPTFKLTAATPAGVGDYVVEAGYRLDAPVSVQTRDLPADPPPAAVGLADQPSQEWRRVNAAAEEHYGSAPLLFDGLIARIRAPLTFASVEGDGQTAAVGMAVAEAGWVGLFEIGTHPAHRRQGRARQVVQALLAWGKQQGARRAYLQVMPENTPALALYEGLGFEEAYRYWYRVAPAPVTGGR